MNAKILVISVFVFILGSLQAQTLLEIDGNEISLEEFLAIYNKNNASAQAIDPKTKEEYLELFINFKLKVREAQELGMDTVKSFQKELAGYRRQLAAPYLTDQNVTEELIKEAYERKLKDVRAAHILVQIPMLPTPEDTLKAYNKIKGIRAQIKDPKSDFERIAKEQSEDPTAKENGGDLGYFSVFAMVYPFESGAYNTPVGEVSQVIRTRFGYHLIYVKDRRPARGEIKVAHIMVQLNPDADQEERDNKRQKADEIYAKLQEGADFAELAKQYSDDKGSASKGGELPPFGTGRMVEVFENAAFSLEADGDFSEPIETHYGWHIIKRLERKGIPPFEEVEDEIKKRIERDNRSRMSKKSFLSRVKSDYAYQLNEKNYRDLIKKVDTEFFDAKWDAEDRKDKFQKTLFTLDATAKGGKKQEYLQYDLLLSLQDSRRFQRKPVEKIEAVVGEQYDRFLEKSLTDFEDEMLERKYPDFKALMQEYHDGILLFDLMDKKVWTKAVKDTTGLEAFYAENKSNYMWPKRVSASIFTCGDESILKATKKLVKKGAKKGKLDKESILSSVNQESQLALSIEQGKFAKGDNELIDKVNWETGFSEDFPSGDKIQFVYIEEVLPVQEKQLDEARGLIISAYQDELEKKWIEELRNKYPIKTYPEVLK